MTTVPFVRRRRRLAVFRLALMLIVLAAVVIALWTSWDDVAPYLGALTAGNLALAFVAALVTPFFTMLGWRRLLADLDSPLGVAPAAGVFFVGQLGKYVPGSIWSVLAQAEMGSRLGVPRRRVGVVGLLAIALALLSGGVLGLPALPVLLGRTELGGYAVVVVVLILAVICYPPLLNWGIRRGLRILRQPPLEHALSGRAIVATLLWFTLSWGCSGLAVMLVAADVGEGLSITSPSLLLLAVCGFALSATFGMISVIFPAGVGVRDGVLALILATVMPLAAAAAVAVVMRFLTILVDVLVAAAGWTWGREHNLIDGDRRERVDPQ